MLNEGCYVKIKENFILHFRDSRITCFKKATVIIFICIVCGRQKLLIHANLLHFPKNVMEYSILGSSEEWNFQAGQTQIYTKWADVGLEGCVLKSQCSSRFSTWHLIKITWCRPKLATQTPFWHWFTSVSQTNRSCLSYQGITTWEIQKSMRSLNGETGWLSKFISKHGNLKIELSFIIQRKNLILTSDYIICL